MKNRFSKSGYYNRFNFSIFIIALSLIFFIIFASSIGQNNISKQQDILENTVKRNIVHCYAVEGKYPESIDYLKAHYGLTYNEDLFRIDYLPIGSNIMPDFTVLYIGE